MNQLLGLAVNYYVQDLNTVDGFASSSFFNFLLLLFVVYLLFLVEILNATKIK